MTKPYQIELRLRAVRYVEAGESRHAVAERLGASVYCVISGCSANSGYRDV